MQLRFIARRGVLLDETDFGRSVDDGKGFGQQSFGRFGVLAGDDAPHGPDLMTQTRFALPVHLGAPCFLPYAFQ